MSEQDAEGQRRLATHQVLGEVAAERAVQRGRWGNAHDDEHVWTMWLTILAGYFGRVAEVTHQATRDWSQVSTEGVLRNYTDQVSPTPMLRAALVKVAATAVAWVEAIDRKG